MGWIEKRDEEGDGDEDRDGGCYYYVGIVSLLLLLVGLWLVCFYFNTVFIVFNNYFVIVYIFFNETPYFCNSYSFKLFDGLSNFG